MSQAPHAQYEKLLVELHREMRAGKSNSGLAESIRKAMDEPWYALAEDEQELFDELSEDLYIIEGKRRNMPIDEEETAENIKRQAQATFKDGKTRETLLLLRKLPTLEADDIYAMARCWRKLGFHYAWICFYDYAAELEPRELFPSSEMAAAAQSTPPRPAQSIHARRRTATTRSTTSNPSFPPMRSIEGLSP